MNTEPKRPQLVRGLGLSAAISINVANMIGTGVFLKARVMTCNVGTPALVFTVWIAAGLLVLAGTFCYAEVGSLLPEAGGQYVFVRRAYGRLLGFMQGWTTFAVAIAASEAALAVGFAIFLNVAVGGVLSADLVLARFPGIGITLHVSYLTLAALAAIWMMALLNCRSVASGGRMALILTVIKVLLVVAVGASAIAFARGNVAHLALSGANGTCEGVLPSARGGIAGFGAAMLGALWAYDGWNNVAPLVGEIKDPARNVARVFVWSTVAVGGLYLFANFAYYYVLTPSEIASVPASSSVATEVMRRFVGPEAVVFVAVALMISSIGALYVSMLANTRVPFAMARDGLFFRRLAKVSAATRVPINAIVAQAAWSSVLTLSGSYDTLTDASIFTLWLFYGLSAGSVFVFRRTMPHATRPYRAFGYPWIPAAFIAVTVCLIINTFVATPRLALTGVALMLAGLPFYAWWTRSAAH